MQLNTEGLRCPKCSSRQGFVVEGNTTVYVGTPGGSSRVTMDPKSKTTCNNERCRYEGRYWQFDMDLPGWVAATDWELLLRQKKCLVTVINTMDTGLSPKLAEGLTGILHLLDAVQDWASDDLGVPSVFSDDT